MKLLDREVEILELVCPMCRVCLVPEGEVLGDNVIMSGEGVEACDITLCQCPVCRGRVVVAFREKGA